MSNAAIFRAIRRRLGVSQATLADAMDCTAANIGFYERGQSLPPEKARRLIDFAISKGLRLTYEHVYDGVQLPEMPRPTEAA
jgi:putative transcriptional regulator